MSSFFQKHIKRASQEAKQEFQGTPKDPVTSARHSQPLNIFKRSVSNLRVTKSLKKSTSSTSTNQSTSNSLRKRVEEVRSEVLPGKKRSTVENEKRLLMDENAHVPQKQDRPPDLRLEYSNFSSFEKLTPDSSGLATLESSHPTTPSPAKPSKESAIGASELSEEDMGQRNSTVRRKPIPLNQKPSLDCFTISPPMSPNTSSVQSSAEMHPPLAVLTNRPASVQMPIPRRRSSLTALHLDSSHFDRPLSSRDGTKHRASTLTNTFPQFSPINLAPLEKAALRPTFSPPLRPPVSNGRPASSSSMALSTSSPAPPFIHLPKTFPNGPVEVRAPSLRDSHHHCIQGHRKMPRSNNKICPTPCMTCGTNRELFWKCVSCALRICGECMAEFSTRGRELERLLVWVEKSGRSSLDSSGKPSDKSSMTSFGKGKGKEGLQNIAKNKSDEGKKEIKIVKSTAKEISGAKVTRYLVKG